MSVNRSEFLGGALFTVIAGGLATSAPILFPLGDVCSPTGLDQTVELDPAEGVDWTVRYSNEEFLDGGQNGDYVPTTVANKVADAVEFAIARQAGDWGFGAPYFTSLPDGFINIYDSPDSGMYANKTCITLDAPKFRDGSDVGILWVTSHEILHARQSGYTTAAGGSFEGYGSWTNEGSARAIDDRYSDDTDRDGPLIVDGNSLMNGVHEDLGDFRDLSLFDLSYRACLFWSYCCEQFGQLQLEPDRGADFIRTFYEAIGEEMEEDGVRDAVATLDQVIRDVGGGSLERVWHDFTICLMTREFDAIDLPNSERYVFLDELPGNNAGGDPYANMERTTIHDGGAAFPQSGSNRVVHFGNRYFELENIVPTGECEVIGVNAVADKEVGWALVGTKPGVAGGPDQAVILSKQRGKEFVQSFFMDPVDPITRLGLIVTGFQEASDFEYTFDRGPFSHSIVRPSASEPEYPGPHDDPERILVRVQVEGPNGLKPAGVGPRSIKGLRSTDFAVSIGGDSAPVLSSAYLGDEYWLVVACPTQRSNGAFDLSVIMCAESGMGVVAVAPKLRRVRRSHAQPHARCRHLPEHGVPRRWQWIEARRGQEGDGALHRRGELEQPPRGRRLQWRRFGMQRRRDDGSPDRPGRQHAAPRRARRGGADDSRRLDLPRRRRLECSGPVRLSPGHRVERQLDRAPFGRQRERSPLVGQQRCLRR